MKHVLNAVVEALEKQRSQLEVSVIDLTRRIRFLRSIEAVEQIIEALESTLEDARTRVTEMSRCANDARVHISHAS